MAATLDEEADSWPCGRHRSDIIARRPRSPRDCNFDLALDQVPGHRPNDEPVAAAWRCASLTLQASTQPLN